MISNLRVCSQHPGAYVIYDYRPFGECPWCKTYVPTEFVETMAAWLMEKGRHSPECRVFDSEPDEEPSRYDENCSCGLKELVEAIAEEGLA